jgi:hypothetical protein
VNISELLLWTLSVLIAREAGDSIKPRVEAKPEPWVSHGKLSQAHEMGDRVWDQPRNFEVYRPLRGLATLVARNPGFRLRLHPGLYAIARFAGSPLWWRETRGSAFGSTLGFMLSPASRARTISRNFVSAVIMSMKNTCNKQIAINPTKWQRSGIEI